MGTNTNGLFDYITVSAEPVPEPGALVPLALGAVLLRRRRHCRG